MKKNIVVLFLLFVCLFESCTQDTFVAPPETDPCELNNPEMDSMNNILYCGSREYYDNETNLFSVNFANGKISKYDFRTNKVVRLCKHKRCTEGECPFYMGRASFLHKYEGLFYYFYWVNDSILDQPNSNVTSDRIAAYNPLTGTYKDVYEDVTKSNYSALRSIKCKNEYMYALEMISTKDNPESEEDYQLTLIKYNLLNQKRDILFTCDDKIRPISDQPAILFVTENNIYFGSNVTGQIWKTNMTGGEFEYLVDGDNNFLALLDAYGVSLCDDWVYFTVYAHDIDPNIPYGRALAIYRVHIYDKTIERIGNMFCQWFFVTDNYVYFEPCEIQYDGVGLLPEHTISRMKHDGTGLEIFPPVTADAESFIITRPWFANNRFYFSLAGIEGGNYPEATAITIEYDITTGQSKWIYDSSVLE